MPRGIAAVVGLSLPAAAMIAVYLHADRQAEGLQRPPALGAVPAGPHPVTPLLSVRRSPASLATSVRAVNFADAMSPVTTAVQDRACVSVAIDGQVVIADNAATAFIPASNAKLLTAAVGLEVLGADYHYTTEARGVLTENGNVQRLVLVGGGDPLLSTAEYPGSGINHYAPFNTTSLESLADALVQSGVKTITNLVGDESRYDTVRDAPGWGDAIEGGDASQLSALMVDDGYVSLKSRTRAESTAGGALQVFRAMLERRGVTIDLVNEGTSDNSPVIAAVQSAPLSLVVAEMLTSSDNDTAELMLKEIGLHATGVGSTAAGSGVVVDTLHGWGVPTDGLVLVDGSGLSRDDRVSCATFVGLLAHVGASGPLYEGLPVAGKTGTLEDVELPSAADGALRAKTGSLAIARSLSGFFPAKDGSTIEFSFLVNGDGAKGRAERLWDDLVRAFASYPQGPSPDDLAPAPAASG